MAYMVKFEVPQRVLGYSDIEFVVWRNGRRFGRLYVSQGALVWRRKWKIKQGRKLTWKDLDKLMDSYGRRSRGK